MSKRDVKQRIVLAGKDSDKVQPLPVKDDLIAKYQAKEQEERLLADQITQEHESKVRQGKRVPIRKGKESTYYTEYLTPAEKELYVEQRANLQSAILKLTELSGYGRNIVKDVLEDLQKRIRYEEKLRAEHIEYLVSFKTQEKLTEIRRKKLRKERSDDLLSLSNQT